MLAIKKKNIFHELALSLFLLLEFDRDTTSASVIKRVHDKAKDALKSAHPYTGLLGEKDITTFLTTKQFVFSIDCGADIVKGDTIRFVEEAHDNRISPPRYLGKRGIIAEVVKIASKPRNPMVYLRVISSGGVWSLKPNSEIFRTMRIIARSEVMRAPWEDESKRLEAVNDKAPIPQRLKSATDQIVKRPGNSK